MADQKNEHKGRFSKQSATNSSGAGQGGGFFRLFFARPKKGQTLLGRKEYEISIVKI